MPSAQPTAPPSAEEPPRRTPFQPSPSQAELDRQLLLVRLGCLVVAIALGAGLWFGLPYLTIEHHRLEPWKAIGIWTGDLMALFWFARFAFVHAVLGRPLVSTFTPDRRRTFKLIMFAGVAALLVDLGLTLYLMWDERAGYTRSQPAMAQLTALQVIKRPAATWYEFDCNFTDATGISHHAHLRIQAWKHILPSRLPPEVAKALGAAPTARPSIPIRYDPRFPVRAWVENNGWDDDNRLYWFSLFTLFIQAAVTGLFLLLLRPRMFYGDMPWWSDIYKALPLASEAFLLLMMGLIDRLMDSIG